MREILYGRQPVLEALRAGRRDVFGLFVRDTVRPTPDLDEMAALAEQRRAPMHRVGADRLDRMAQDGQHQGVALETSKYIYTPLDAILAAVGRAGEPGLLLLLDHIQDPQNLGAILRTAEACGAHGVILPKDRAAGVTPAAVRVSAGASEHLAVCQAVNLGQVMARLKDEGYWIAGLEALEEALPYTEADLSGALALVVGSEGQGLGRLVRERCDFLIRLPLHGRVASLNAAAACAVALYEARRRRGPAAKTPAA